MPAFPRHPHKEPRVSNLPAPIQALVETKGNPIAVMRGSGFYFPRHDKTTIVATLRAVALEIHNRAAGIGCEYGIHKRAFQQLDVAADDCDYWADQIEKEACK